MRRYGVAAVAACMAFGTSGCWLQLGGIATRTNANPNEVTITTANVGQLHQAWKTHVEIGVGAPVTYGGRVFVRYEDVMTALRSTDGAQLWQNDLEPNFQNAPTITDPAIVGGRVLSGIGYAVLVGGTASYDMQTGSATYGSNDGNGALFSAPAVDGGITSFTGAGFNDDFDLKSFVSYGTYHGFLGVNPLLDPGRGPSHPMLMGGHVYVTKDQTLFSFATNGCAPSPDDASMCAAEWSIDLGSNTSMPVGTGTHIAVGLANGNLAVVDTAGNVAWQGVSGSTAATAPAFAFNKFYVGAADGHVHEFDAAGCGSPTCSEVSTVAVSTAIPIQPLVAGDVLYTVTTNGKLVAFSAGTCTIATCPALLSAQVEPTEQIGSVIVDQGLAIMTTYAGNVVAYKL